jgi:hypothetical protein
VCQIKKKNKENRILIVQPVIRKSFIDEFGIQENHRIQIPALSNDSFSPVMDGDELDKEDQKQY